MAAARTEMADASSPADSPRYKQKNTSVAAFMFHYPFLAASREVFGGSLVANGFKLLQNPS